MPDSRSKGCRGERELAAALTLLTGVEWRRTAQRSGVHTGDVEADNVLVHVECKRYRAGLSMMLARIAKANAFLCITPNAYVCRLDHMEDALFGPERWAGTTWAWNCHASRTPVLLHDALIQAERDRHIDSVALVCARKDHGPWLCAWKPRDTQLIRDRIGSLIVGVGP